MTIVYAAFVFVTGWVSRANFYPVFEGDSFEDMEKMIEIIEKQKGQNAYLGAIKMKFSNLQKGASAKLKTFKSGRELLEDEIKKDPKNIEWRFLRLAVQEHAPKIVKYSKNLEIDRDFIIVNFNSAPLELQKIIRDYAAKSEILTPADLY